MGICVLSDGWEKLYYVGFAVFTAVVMHNSVFWDNAM
jgi:hypothetical protein